MSIENQFKETLQEEKKKAIPEIVRMTERIRYEDKIAQVTELVVNQQLEIKSLRDRVAELEGTSKEPEPKKPEASLGTDHEALEHERLVEMFMSNGDRAGLLGYIQQRERVVAERAAKEASRDPLTSLPNRRSFYEDAGKRLHAVQEYATYKEFLKSNPGEHERRVEEPADPGDFSVIMLDLDHFKSINDTYGHAGGDAVLKGVADILRDTLRPTDELARYGGEEFIIAFTSRSSSAARFIVAEKIRRAIESATIIFNGQRIPVTASLGAAKWHPGDTIVKVIQKADDLLYKAKHGGRNQVMIDMEEKETEEKTAA